QQRDAVAFRQAVAGWMAYLIKASARFGRAWQVSDPFAEKIAEIVDRVGADSKELANAILAINAIFDRSLAASDMFRANVVAGLDGLLSDDPMAFVRHVRADPIDARLKRPARSA
ncbi:MAG: mannitol dehydrogenase family protein, partial [Mesorhizobium sp.]